MSPGLRDTFIACVLMASALAVAAPVRPAATDDFRAAYATPQDIVEGKRVADASCVRCHGPNGISSAKGVPHLAGQRAVYLHRELQAYKSGARGKGMMADASRFLSEDALVKVAAWYASLDPAMPVQAAANKGAPTATEPANAGKAAASGCAGCHGETGVSGIPGMPSLAGLDPQYLVAAMKSYKGGQRKSDMMTALVAALGDTDIHNIAMFYAAQKPGRAQTPATGNKLAGKAAAAACDACHGGAGNATTPSLAGQDATYFVAAMGAYRSGSRADPIMKGQAAAVGDAAAADLAAWYASLEPQPPKLRKVLSTDDWSQRCDRCHGVNGNSTDPRLPALAAQRADYLEWILKAYRSGTRKSPAMTAMSQMLTDADVGTLSAYYAQQKARAVVYVILPAPK